MKTDYKSKETKDIYFPVNGPYYCLFCASIVPTNKDFLNHVKAKHLEEADEGAMEKMEKYLNA